MPLMRSWIDTANTPDTDFPLNNLPCGVFSIGGGSPRCGVAIGRKILDVTALEEVGLLRLSDKFVFNDGAWNKVMALGPEAWARLRIMLFGFLAEDTPIKSQVHPYVVDQSDVRMHLPLRIAEFAQGSGSLDHAQAISALGQVTKRQIPANWHHAPTGQSNRASGVVVSGSDIRRPMGMTRPDDIGTPQIGAARDLDFSVELGAIAGLPARRRLNLAEAEDAIFGYVLLGNWIARDLAVWDNTSPHAALAAASTISPWIVMRAALEGFRVAPHNREVPLLPHLDDAGTRPLPAITLQARLEAVGGLGADLCQTSARTAYFSAAQQIAHSTARGFPVSTGDLFGSGTLSGPGEDARASLADHRGKTGAPFVLTKGVTRAALEDGDRVRLTGHAQGDGYRIGFGDCSGRVLPAEPLR